MLVKLTRNKSAIINAKDFRIIKKHSWYAVRIKGRSRYVLWYAVTHIDGRTTYMHRLIMGAKPGQYIDHKDQDGLNNRRSNLRFATRTEQARNTRAKTKRAEIHSRFKGVSWHTSRNRNGTISGRWVAQVHVGKKCFKRYSHTEDGAAAHYRAMCDEHFGEFARFE